MPMAPVQFYQRPDYMGNAFDTLIGAEQQHEQQNAQQDALDQQTRAQQNAQQTAAQQAQIQTLLGQYLKQPADVQAKLYATAPDAIKQYLLDPRVTSTHAPTPDEQFHAMVTANNLKTFPTLPQSAQQQGTFKEAYGVLPPKETVDLSNAQDVTGNPQAWTPQVQQRQAIEDKRALNAKEQQVDLPESKSKIGLQGAQTMEANALAGEASAGAGLKRAQTQKTVAEIQAIGDDGKAVLQEVANNPQSFFSLTPDQKKAYAKAGGIPPRKLSAEATNRQMSAQMNLGTLNDISALVDKWHNQGVDISGPMLGRYNAVTNTWGDAILPSGLPPAKQNEYQADIAALQEWFGANKLQELKAIVGSRPSAQMMQALNPPNIAQGHVMLKGAIDGMQRRLNETVNQIDKSQWGTNKPPAVSSPAAPVRIQKTQRNAAGQTRVVYSDDNGATWHP